jgi:hypothetical protein
MILNFIDRIKINHEGFNLSCVPFENEFICTIRKNRHKSDMLPEELIYLPDKIDCYNKCFILKLDSSFNVLSSNLLDENTGRIRFISWSTGIEDSRLIDSNSFVCVSLDTNTEWKPEVCYVEFDNYKLSKLLPLYIEGKQYTKPEKNWLLLKKEGNIFYFLYWYNPFQIISVDMTTGKGNIILSYDIPGISLSSHGGACIYLEKEKKYLVLARNMRDYGWKTIFQNNSWLLLDEDFYLKGISDTFNFIEKPVNEYMDNTFYESCQSLILKNDILHMFVSISEKDVYVYTIELNDILNSIQPLNM